MSLRSGALAVAWGLEGRACSMQYGSRDAHSYVFLTPAHPQPSLGVVKILQQGSSPLLCYVHLVFQVLHKGYTTGAYKSQRQLRAGALRSPNKINLSPPLQQR